MKHAAFLLVAVAIAFGGVHSWLGYDATYQIGYGALTMMAALISVTFLVLFMTRATPLALGMAFSWAGASTVMGWWWLYSLMERPLNMVQNQTLFGFLSLYFVGAILHFMVMQRSLGFARGTFILPVALSIFASTVLHLFF